MAAESSVVHVLTNQAGRIRMAGGNEIEVTFSFYRYQETGMETSGRCSAGGCCRVSNGSDVLTTAFQAGLPLLLFGADIEAEIKLTSAYSFHVVGVARERGNAVTSADDRGSAAAGENAIQSSSFRQTKGAKQDLTHQKGESPAQFVIRRTFSTVTLHRFRSED